MSDFSTSTSTAQDEDKISSEERIKWLRDRGIQVHIPGESVITESSDDLTFENIVVKIPTDERLPYEEIKLNLVLGNVLMIIQCGDFLIFAFHSQFITLHEN